MYTEIDEPMGNELSISVNLKSIDILQVKMELIVWQNITHCTPHKNV